jgi:hypothetical protein
LFRTMQTTIIAHVSDSEFGLQRTDSSHVISDEEDVSVFLPIGIELDMRLKDWLLISKISNSKAFISVVVNDKIRNSELAASIGVAIENDIIVLTLTETLELKISTADWRKVADKIVFEIVSA